MTTKPSTSLWKPIDLPALRCIELTTDTRELSRENWPAWASGSTQFNRFTIHAENKFQSSSSSTGIIATLMSERVDWKDAPNIYNYNIYLIAETTDGRFFQSPPIKTNDPKHQSTSPSTWFDDLGSPL
jgi:hypothetical protein